jgi:hypothetical protein
MKTLAITEAIAVRLQNICMLKAAPRKQLDPGDHEPGTPDNHVKRF